jgi:hypothetical protein
MIRRLLLGCLFENHTNSVLFTWRAAAEMSNGIWKTQWNLGNLENPGQTLLIPLTGPRLCFI